MNRPELFRRVLGAAAASGVAMKASAYETASPPPALVVFEVDEVQSHDACARIVAQWQDVTQGTPLQGVKAVVLQGGITLTVLDAEGRVINRTLEEP